MAYEWQTIEQASLTLGISTRTLHRRITKGDLETRLENGRREVLVCLPEETDQPAIPPGPSADEEAELVGQAASASPDPGLNLDRHLALADDRIRRADLALSAFQHSLTIVENEARRVRTAAHAAWAFVGVLIAGALIVTVWATHNVTRARANTEQLVGQVKTLSDTVQTREQQVEHLRQETETARLTAARAEGELKARIELSATVEAAHAEAQRLTGAAHAKAVTAAAPAPATRPSLVERLLAGRAH